MCGIMGYVGPQQATPILLAGLRRLEYRGYDSAGVAVTSGERFRIRKAAGKLSRLTQLIEDDPLSGTAGIGHTRWATHGAPTDGNAHPHCDPAREVVLVHNGIIENYLELREQLLATGAVFASETDTEVLAHLVAAEYDGDLVEAVQRAVGRASGAYALVVMTRAEPGRIVAVRKVSPLIVGIGDGEMFLASDPDALLHHTRDALYIDEGELVDITASGARIEALGGKPVVRAPMRIDWDAEQAQKGGYDHFMLKEIFEQPSVIADTIRGRVDAAGTVALDGVSFDDEFARRLSRIWITACGTAFHAGLVAKEVFEGICRIPTECTYAHELRYSDPLIQPGDLVIAISQSGETADTLEASRLARRRGGRVLAITNRVGSTLARLADDIIYTRAGPEIAVASTKAYVAMLVAEYLLAMRVGIARGDIDDGAARTMAATLLGLGDQVAAVLQSAEDVESVAKLLDGVDDIYFIGRGLDYPIAMEGSLKLKEISYLHSEAMPAGELKHGTLALVTDATPVLAVITQSHVYDKTASALEEVRARGASVIAVCYDDDTKVADHADTLIRIPHTDDRFSPVLSIVPLQLLSYYVARDRGHDIDQPRNLAKSVTVE